MRSFSRTIRVGYRKTERCHNSPVKRLGWRRSREVAQPNLHKLNNNALTTRRTEWEQTNEAIQPSLRTPNNRHTNYSSVAPGLATPSVIRLLRATNLFSLMQFLMVDRRCDCEQDVSEMCGDQNVVSCVYYWSVSLTTVGCPECSNQCVLISSCR